MAELEPEGYAVRTSRVQSATTGAWFQVFAGPYDNVDQARRDEARIRQIPGYADARLIAH